MEATGATFTFMNGYLDGRLSGDDGAAMLLALARVTVWIGKHLGDHRLDLLGTGLGDMGIPVPLIGSATREVERRTRGTLNRLCDMAEEEGVSFRWRT